ncbi:MAG: metallopeptidase TldD-related protein [Myxococcota bacterium]
MAIGLDDLEALVQRALSEGAKAAEVLAIRGSGWKIHLKPGGAPSESQTQRDELVVRVWVEGGRVGRMQGRFADGRELVGQALAATFESPESAYAGPMASIGGLASGLGTFDRRYPNLTSEDRLEVVMDAERQVRTAGSRFRSTGFRYEDEHTWRGLANSRGLLLEEPGTRYRLEGGVAGEGLSLRDHIETRAFASIASLPLGTNLARRGAELMEDGKTLEPGPVRVVLPPLPVSRIIALLGEHFHPDRLTSGEFFLSPSEDGMPTISEQFHIVDDGSRPGALHTRMFDDRGVPPVPLTLIREGRVDARFLDPETARRLDTRPTGHCWGDGLGPSNLLMRSGTRSLNALLTEIGGPSLMVDDLDPAGIDIRTGAFDMLVDGRVLEANVPVGAMRRVRLSGNLRDLLSNIVDVGNDTDRIGHVDAAGLIADGLILG